MIVFAPGDGGDRRARRTRSAIISAFNRLILERGYASLTPGDVAGAADIGRSTFYEHFRGLGDVLAKSLETLLVPLAEGCFQARPPEDARRRIEHVWENRRLAYEVFKDETHPIVLRSFAAAFEASLRRAQLTTGSTPVLALDLVALALAASQLALLRAWISGRSGHSAQVMTDALHASGRASMLALMSDTAVSAPSL